MYADDNMMCCFFPQKCNWFHRTQTPAPTSSNFAWCPQIAAVILIAVSVIWIILRKTHNWLGSKNTDTIDNIITDDAIASCCVDEYRGNRSSERGVNFSIGTNYQCSADDDSSEDSSHYSDCEFFKETVLNDPSKSCSQTPMDAEREIHPRTIDDTAVCKTIEEDDNYDADDDNDDDDDISRKEKEFCCITLNEPSEKMMSYREFEAISTFKCKKHRKRYPYEAICSANDE